MTSSMGRVMVTARVLLRQNRVLVPVLMLWPCALTAILLAAEHGRPATEDVSAILTQELLYGVALVALRASSALGAERKARRLPQLLGRALGRAELLAALGMATLVPFAGYLLVWALNAVFSCRLGGFWLPLAAPFVAAAATGAMLCAAGMFFSVWLPQAGASVACGVVMAAGFGAGMRGTPVAGPLYAALVRGGRVPAVESVLVLLASAAVAWLAALVFSRRDLRME